MSEFAEVLATLRRIRGISPFFALDIGRPSGEWLPGESLVDGSGALDRTVDAIARRYRTDERRVATSLFFLSYTSRVLSPVVGALVVDNRMLDVRPGNLWWHYAPDTGLQVRIDSPGGGPGIEDALRPVVKAIRDVVPVAEGLLWGNAASSAAGALRMVLRSGTASEAECGGWGERLWSTPPLAETGEFLSFPGDLFSGDLVFRRRSCCLYYRLDNGGKCGDCPLVKA
ncbi:MAG TPA: (2Fe-2S)-binding protein [Pseudonocardiaceae bacterium]|nr:(2Fe-2S)-binding protein [Pseudonocardiaceae bacterium]